jgi:hypothetical protein
MKTEPVKGPAVSATPQVSQDDHGSRHVDAQRAMKESDNYDRQVRFLVDRQAISLGGDAVESYAARAQPAGGLDLLSLRADPSVKTWRKEPRPVRDTSRAVQTPAAQLQVNATLLDSADSGRAHTLSTVPDYLTRQDHERVKRLARRLNRTDWEDILSAFCDAVVETLRHLKSAPESKTEHDPRAPWYQVDLRRGFLDEAATGSFAHLADNVDYVKALGFENLLVHDTFARSPLERYAESANPDPSLGGSATFAQLQDALLQSGMQVGSGGVLHLVSASHPWAKASSEPSSPPSDRTGARVHELDLRNAQVLRNVLDGLGREVLRGVRVFALRELESLGEGLGFDQENVHTVVALLKLFLRSIAQDCQLIADVATVTSNAIAFSGERIHIGDQDTASEADLFVWHEGSLSLLTTLYERRSEPVEAALHKLETLGSSAHPLVYLDTYDLLPLDALDSTETKDQLTRALRRRNVPISADESFAASQFHEHFGDDLAWLRLSLFCLYALPATPIMKAGSELSLATAPAMQDGLPGPTMGHFWRALRNKDPLAQTLIQLNRLRDQHDALRGSHIQRLGPGTGDLLAWERRAAVDSDRTITFIANLGHHGVQCTLARPRTSSRGLRQFGNRPLLACTAGVSLRCPEAMRFLIKPGSACFLDGTLGDADKKSLANGALRRMLPRHEDPGLRSRSGRGVLRQPPVRSRL